MRDNYVTTEAHAIFEDHALVFRRVDNPIHWINLYLVDSAVRFGDTYLLDSD